MSKRSRLLARLKKLVDKKSSLENEIQNLRKQLQITDYTGKYIHFVNGSGYEEVYIHVRSQVAEDDYIKVSGPFLSVTAGDFSTDKDVYVFSCNNYNEFLIFRNTVVTVCTEEDFRSVFSEYINYIQENQDRILENILKNEPERHN